MANLNAILKNKMGLSAEQAKKSKVLASLSGSYRQNMKSIHYSQLVPNTNQFYTEKELEDLADIIQILGGVAQNLLVRKKDAEQYEILAGHRRWRASQIVVQRGFPEYAYLPCLVIECNDDVAELLLILTNSSARSDLNGYEQMMQVVRLQELLPKINKDETLKGRVLRKEIALSTKRSESTIQNLMYTAKHLSKDGMQAFKEEKLTPAAALYLAKQSCQEKSNLSFSNKKSSKKSLLKISFHIYKNRSNQRKKSKKHCRSHNHRKLFQKKNFSLPAPITRKGIMKL